MISLSPAIAVHLPTIKCQGSRLSMPMLLIFFLPHVPNLETINHASVTNIHIGDVC